MTDTPRYADLNEIRTLLGAVEAIHHQHGWRRQPNPVLYVAYDSADTVTAAQIEHTMSDVGKPIRAGRYTACPMISAAEFRDVFITHRLQSDEAIGRFVINYCFHDFHDADANKDDAHEAEDYRRMMRQPGIVGFLYLSETLMVTREQAHAAEQKFAAGKPYTGGQRSRTGVMVDVLERAHCVRRSLDTEPCVDLDVRHAGRLAIYLRMLVDATLDRLPEPGKIMQRYARQRVTEDASEHTAHPGPA